MAPKDPQAEPTISSSSDAQDTTKLVEEALAEAQASMNEVQEAADSAAPAGAAIASAAVRHGAGVGGIEMLGDVDLEVVVELGRTEMLVEDVLKLGPGAVVELDKLAGDPVDVYVNQRLVARGEVLVLNDNFCIRISEIVADIDLQAAAAAQEAATQ